MATEDVKVEVKYPRWVKRGPNIGEVLCQNEEEEKKLLADWKENPASDTQKPVVTRVTPTEAELTASREANRDAVDKAHKDRDAEGRERLSDMTPAERAAEKAADKDAEKHSDKARK